MSDEQSDALKAVEDYQRDAETVAGFLAGWWPGLEDGLSWPRPSPDDHPALLAADRILEIQRLREIKPPSIP